MTGIFYGSSTGNTESLAKEIAAKLGIEASHVFDVSSASANQTAPYQVLLLGSSTCGDWAIYRMTGWILSNR